MHSVKYTEKIVVNKEKIAVNETSIKLGVISFLFLILPVNEALQLYMAIYN